MNSDLEKRIRDRAYEIWENEGRPQGRSEDHWAQARAEFSDARSETGIAPQEPAAAPPAPKTRSRKAAESEPLAIAKATKASRSRAAKPSPAASADPDSVGEALQAKQFSNAVSSNTTPETVKATVKKGAAGRGKRSK
ncbi:DUF2934 domain-containing protein [Altericroceibacterium xinjiangense]|uniref:DUF2934 domain-containing protein n=1 Tax=Altericroceibacterium xinjiangense TaxID=762261 RepID=UPI000F7E49C0|nr:DUF2934 domain-containing protein [Altericroceibacterium xinjiangense]